MINVTLTSNDKSVGSLALAPKSFKTGSQGFFTQGKIEIHGKRYQCQFQLVEIGSKAATTNKK